VRELKFCFDLTTADCRRAVVLIWSDITLNKQQKKYKIMGLKYDENEMRIQNYNYNNIYGMYLKTFFTSLFLRDFISRQYSKNQGK
jgi:hypothetical protein